MRMFKKGVFLTSVLLATIGYGHAQACGCPDNWLIWNHNGRCYFSSIASGSPKENYFGARRRCQEVGGDLVTMADEFEYRHVRADLHNQTSYEDIWIGACWSPSDSSFKYVDGSDVPAVVPRGSISGLPAFGAFMSSVVGQLVDGHPHAKKHYVCRKEYCSRSVQTAWCNEPQSSTLFTDPSSDADLSTAMLGQTTSESINDIPGQTLVTAKHTPDGMAVTGRTGPTHSPDSSQDDNSKEGEYINIGIGVGVFLVVVILCVLVACIISRKRRNRKANGDYPQENNLNMDTKRTDQPLSNNMLTGHTNPSDKLMYEESGYAEVNGQLNEAVPGKSVPDKDVVYDTATVVDIGFARKQDINDMALYATPVRVRGNTEKEKDDDSSDEENT